MIAVFELCIALPDHPAVFAIGVPYLAAVHTAAAFAEDRTGEAAGTVMLTAHQFSTGQFFLHHIEHLCGYIAGWLFST